MDTLDIVGERKPVPIPVSRSPVLASKGHIMLRLTAGLLCMVMFAADMRAQFNIDELAKSLLLQPVKGKAGSVFILNRGLLDTFDTPVTESMNSLARSLGFVDSDGKADPIVVTIPWSAEWLSTVKKHHQEGKLKGVQFINIGSPVAALRTVMADMKQKHQENHKGFQEYLKGQKVDLQAAKLASIDAARLTWDEKQPVLHYLTQRFIIQQAIEYFRQQQLEVVRLSPNLSFGGPYAGDFEQNSDALVLEAWRQKALIPWVAERSWQSGEYSAQSLGYFLALACSAGARQPVICDLHAGQGNYATGIRRSFYVALAHGAQRIRFVGAIPPELTKGPDSLGMTTLDNWKVIRELCHEASALDPVLSNVRPRSSDVAILVSLTQSLYDPSAWVSEECKAIFHAARMSGHNVSVFTEEDVQEGKLQKLATLILLGSHVQQETAKVLKNWVSNGATIACVGGVAYTEYHQSNADMLELQGLTAATWQPLEKPGPVKITLAQVKPTDSIHYSYLQLKFDYPVVYGKLKTSGDDKQKERSFVVGKYNDGSPAIVKHEYAPDKLGHVWWFGSPLGSGWIKKTLTGRKWQMGDKADSYNHQILFKYLEGDAGDVVLASTGDAKYDVITNNLSVETVLLEGEKRFVMIPINWASEPQEVWLTAQFIPKGMDKARSLSQGLLNTIRLGVTLNLPKKYKVDVADVIVIE